MSGLANSPEAAGAVANVWTNVLGTPVDPTWQAAQQAFLAGGGTLNAVLTGLANSPKAAAAVANVWTNVLGTPVDPNWQAAQQGFLAGGGTLSAVTTGLANSPEAAGAVGNVWTKILGTPVDPNWQVAQQTFLGSGGTLTQITSGLADSSEAGGIVATTWSKIFGRTVDPYWQMTQQSFLATGGSLSAIAEGLATSSEATSDINDTWQLVVGQGTISSDLLTQIQSNLPAGGISGAVSLILADPQAQQTLTNDSNSIIQTPLTSQQAQEEVQSLDSSTAGTVGLTWLNIAANLTNNLINFLNPIASAQAEALPTKPIDTSTPLPTLEPSQIPSFPIPAGDKVAFVGGLLDRLVSGIIGSEAQAYAANHPNASAYFTYLQGDQLAAYIKENGGHVVVIGHSYGGDTAATVIAQSSVKIDALITLDPMSLFTPSYQKVAANISMWLDFNAVGGGVIDESNVVAGLGGDWGQPVSKYASYYANVNLDHAAIGGQQFITHLIGQ